MDIKTRTRCALYLSLPPDGHGYYKIFRQRKLAMMMMIIMTCSKRFLFQAYITFFLGFFIHEIWMKHETMLLVMLLYELWFFFADTSKWNERVKQKTCAPVLLLSCPVLFFIKKGDCGDTKDLYFVFIQTIFRQKKISLAYTIALRRKYTTKNNTQ